ncbi:MAG: hypothetical protein IT288_02490 [Bdellovibrionales bacterium]|nr:hypothetical protein [Bdellovibrionales bacterium]
MKTKTEKRDNLGELIKTFNRATRPFVEIVHGVRKGTIPYFECGAWALMVSVGVALGVDEWLLKKAHLSFLYPYNHPIIYWSLQAFLLVSGFFFWGIREAVKLNRLLSTLTSIFVEAGLKTNMGRVPSFVADRPIDFGVREMVLSMNGVPLSAFKQAREKLETDVFGFIEEMKDERRKGLIKIKYSEKDIPKIINLESPYGYRHYDFIVGNTRTGEKRSNLETTPHLLIAGTSNSGKSTYLKQFISTLYLNNRSCEFTLIDLKNGLESIQFHNLPRVKVVTRPQDAVEKLARLQKKIAERAKFLLANGCHKIEEFFALPKDKKKWTEQVKSDKDIGRHVVIVDEAAELFLVGAELNAEGASKARRIVAQLAAQGRAVGVHIIVSTQRPDVKVIDGTIKTNLQGRLCFQMPDNASSMTILDSVRAADLPDIKGRAIWRDGTAMTEVQVPLLSDEKIEELLSPMREKKVVTPNLVVPPDNTSKDSDEAGL